MQSAELIDSETPWRDLKVYRPQTTKLAVPAPSPFAADIAIYTDWNQWLTAGGGLVRTIAGVLQLNLKPGPALKAITAAFYTFYLAIESMNNAIVDGITDMNAGKAPAVVFTPTKLPDWPIGDKPDLFTSSWDTIQPLLQKLDTVLAAKYPGSPIIVGLGGIINAGDKVIATLKAFYPNLGGGK